ncbi:hypothetical protein KQI63_06920 [bacterium]|nr:hypothetical protein [bacterium]
MNCPTAKSNQHLLLQTFLSLLMSVVVVLGQETPVRTFGEGQFPKVGDAKGMLQDHRGVLWMWGTRGITWYDGTRFGHFSAQNGLPSDYVYTIISAPDSTLYFSTYGGLVQFDPVTMQFDTLLTLPRSPIRDVALHEKGLFVATDGGVMFHDDRGSFLIAVMPEGSPDAANYMVQRLAYDASNDLLWAATDRYGVARIEVDKLWPLFELHEGYADPDALHNCPAAFRTQARVEKSKLSEYVIDDAKTRIDLWQKASRFLRGSPEEDVFATFGVLIEPTTGDPIIWSRQHAYRVLKNNSLQQISLPNESAVLNSVSISHDKSVTISRGSCAYRVEGMRAVKFSEGSCMLNREIRVHYKDLQGINWLIDVQGDLHRISSSEIQVYSERKDPYLLNLHHVRVQDSGSILFASGRGISRMDGVSIQPLVSFDQLEGDYVNFAVDKYRNFLIATSTRIYLYEHGSDQIRPLTDRLRINTTNTKIDRDAKGNLYFILSGHLYRWDGRHLVWHKGSEYAGSLHLDYEDDGGVFIGKWPYLLEHRYGKKRFYTELDVGEEAPDKLFSDLTGQNISMIDLPYRFLLDDYAAMFGARGPDGAYWTGTFNAGIIRVISFEDVQRTVDSLQVFDTRTGLPANGVTGLREEPDGDLIFLLTEGAVRVTSNGLEALSFELPQNAVLTDLMIDGKGRFIIGTTKGLVVQDSDRRYTFDRNLGLPEDEVVALHRLDDGRLLVQQANGFYLIQMDEVLAKIIPGSPPFIESITVDSLHLGSADYVEIRTARRALQCQLALPDYSNEDLHQFSWKLVGFDRDFRPYSKQTHVEYTNLPPGTYQLQVRAKSGLGEERSLVTPLTVIVPKRFRETFFFNVLIGLSIVGAAGLVFWWRLSIVRKEQKRELEIQREKLLVANRLAASVAHEFNNPLQIILGSYELVRQKAIDPERQDMYLDRIPEQVSRMRALIQKLLRIREIREVDYAAGVKILDIHPADTSENPSDPPDTSHSKLK